MTFHKTTLLYLDCMNKCLMFFYTRSFIKRKPFAKDRFIRQNKENYGACPQTRTYPNKEL